MMKNSPIFNFPHLITNRWGPFSKNEYPFRHFEKESYLQEKYGFETPDAVRDLSLLDFHFRNGFMMEILANIMTIPVFNRTVRFARFQKIFRQFGSVRFGSRTFFNG
jgi:hypothetical protein